ncbi:MAG TPA: NIPSNAP family protein [Bryobacteraceae bacterium]|jgi:NIPSNAP|nr:NIPSNAP family protein [Bryobacteraceae bacterium]
MLRRNLFTLLAVSAAIGVGFQIGRSTTARAASNHVFEIRTYTAEPGKLEALQARFRDHTVDIFNKHGMTSVGYFAPSDDPLSKNTLIYILEFPSRDAAKKSWDAFRNDPEWQKVQKESEANGKLVTKVDSVFAEPTDFSPLK